jgi:hypothetical protein
MSQNSRFLQDQNIICIALCEGEYAVNEARLLSMIFALPLESDTWPCLLRVGQLLGASVRCGQHFPFGAVLKQNLMMRV